MSGFLLLWGLKTLHDQAPPCLPSLIFQMSLLCADRIVT